ncbi:MAG: hypothetical protein IPM51_05290 [Sphingobacteriaceae bacterium]|nr:hypothetical protein [Sphingobacteriaceae bacterium]
MKLKHFSIPIACLMILFSCSENKESETIQPTEETVVKDTTPVTVDDTTKFKFDFAIANIPSPVNSLQDLGKWGISYDNSCFNDVANISKYTNEFKKAVNLGVYNIDMSYAMVSDNGQDVLKYMKNVMSLSDGLGLKNAVSAMVGKRAESNLGNKDSLFKIIDEIFVKSDDYLRTNDRVYTAANVFTGSWLESLYIVCKVGETNQDAAILSKVKRHLWEQRFHLGNLINLLNDYKDKKETSDIINELKPIHEEISAVKDDKDMNDSKLKSIADKIILLRNKMTN